MASAFIGTSGWSYKGWRESFLRDVPQKDWLRYCAERFTGIEANGTFYRLQSEETFRKWRDETPRDFRFAIKGHRMATHFKRLKDSAEPVGMVRKRALAMGDKLAAVVWQLPQTMEKSPERLERFLDVLDDWPEARHAIEFRHRSWFDDEVAALLSRRDIAVCQSDAPDWPLWDVVTTDMVYVRLHGHTRRYASRYSGGLLDRWASKVDRWLDEGRDVHVYFDNDSEGHAPHDALRLMERVEAAPDPVR